MRIKLWGVRGSLPSPLTPAAVEQRLKETCEALVDAGIRDRDGVEKFLKQLPVHRSGGYGGNTPCIEVKAGQQRIVVDGGSGIRSLGYELLQGPCGQGQGEVHIMFTHFHWDHLMGLPFFAPIFIPGNRIHVYSVQPELREVFETVFRKPYFPVPLKDIGAKIEYHRLEPRQPKPFGDLTVTPYQLDHPDPCWGYRFEHGGKVYAHCVDTECKRVTREALGPDLPLYQGVDLMVFDAQYTLMETIEKVNWGHAAAGLGLDIALREGVKRVLFMHHDPASSDEKIATVETQTRRYYETARKALRDSKVPVHEVEWGFAREGLELEI